VSAVPNFFSKAYSLLKDGGKLVVTTCHGRRGRIMPFSKSLIEEDKVLDVFIEQREFDQLVVNNDGVLPVRFFSFQELRGMLSPFFLIQRERVFHELYPKTLFDLLIFRDRLINVPWCRNFFGRDMIIEAVKK
jgi:hypothetical protein